jgi:hypothetical protein
MDGTSFSHMTTRMVDDEEDLPVQLEENIHRRQYARHGDVRDAEQEVEEILGPASVARRRVCFNLPVRTSLDQSHAPRPHQSSAKGILKKEESVQERLQDLRRQEDKIQKVLPALCAGSRLVKYNTDGKPNARWFALSADGSELYWSKARGATKRGIKWVFKEKSRSRQLANVQGVFYGPYNNQRVFQRFLDRQDTSVGKDWLCVTVAFDDRTLDFVCSGDREVTNWFTCVQGLAPLVGSFLRLGSLLWRRLIMKLNYYGLDPKHWYTHEGGGRRKGGGGMNSHIRCVRTYLHTPTYIMHTSAGPARFKDQRFDCSSDDRRR